MSFLQFSSRFRLLPFLLVLGLLIILFGGYQQGDVISVLSSWDQSVFSFFNQKEASSKFYSKVLAFLSQPSFELFSFFLLLLFLWQNLNALKMLQQKQVLLGRFLSLLSFSIVLFFLFTEISAFRLAPFFSQNTARPDQLLRPEASLSFFALFLFILGISFWSKQKKGEGRQRFFSFWILILALFLFPDWARGQFWTSDMFFFLGVSFLLYSLFAFYSPVLFWLSSLFGALCQTRAVQKGLECLGASSPTLSLKGMAMGAADTVPGVSGGTVAYMSGIYEDLIQSLHSFGMPFFRELRKGLFYALTRPRWGFVLPLFGGIIAGLFFFTRILPLPTLLELYPEPIYALFFGLILGSSVILLKQHPLRFTRIKNIQDNKKNSKNAVFLGRPFLLGDLLTFALGLLAGFLVVNLVPLETPETSWFTFLSGFIAICAMILPGISGSFILLLLKKYSFILGAVAQFNLSVLLPFAFGAVCGLLVFAQGVSWLLKRFHHRMMLLITGILLGSLWMIWPYQERTYLVVREKKRLIETQPYWPDFSAIEGLWSLLIMGISFAVVFFVDAKVQAKKRQNTTT